MVLPEGENVSRHSENEQPPAEGRRAGAAGGAGEDTGTDPPPPDQFRPQAPGELAVPFPNPPYRSLTGLNFSTLDVS